VKVLRKLLAFLVVIALLGGGAVYALQPSEDIKPSEKLSSVNSSMDLASLNKEFISNVSYSNSKLSTSLKIDNEMFLSILNHATKDSAEIQEGSYKLVGNRVAAKLPVQLSFINSETNVLYIFLNLICVIFSLIFWFNIKFSLKQFKECKKNIEKLERFFYRRLKYLKIFNLIKNLSKEVVFDINELLNEYTKENAKQLGINIEELEKFEKELNEKLDKI